MDDKELQEAQRRLEEKQASLKRTLPTPIGWEAEVEEYAVVTCMDCGADVKVARWALRYSADNTRCEPCQCAEDARLEAERLKREEESRERQRKARIQRLLDRSGIGQRFRDCKWDDYEEINPDAAKIKKVCRDYAESFGKDACDIVMIGACGTGKNMLASLIGRHIIWSDFSYEYTTAMRLVRAVKDSWRDKETTEQEVIDSFTSPDLLCIDEIGVQFGSPTEQLFITEVINNRYEAMKPTLLISNLTLPQIEEVLGKRAVDRFHERGKFLVFKWESYRRRK